MSGISVAKNFRQEATIYDEFAADQPAGLPVTLRPGLRLQRHLPVLVHRRRARHGAARLLRRQRGARRRDVSAGDWYLFLQASTLFWFPLTSIASFWSQFQQGLAAAERVFALIDAEPRVVQTRRRAGRPAARAGSSSATSTSPTPPSQPVLRRLQPDDRGRARRSRWSATPARASRRSASWSPASTSSRAARSLIDGHDIRTFDLPAVPPPARRRAAVAVPLLRHRRRQHPLPPPGRDRRRGRDGRAAGRRRRLARSAAGRAATPRSASTGAALSMGQRQLVALARVLLQDPAIVILDEATASVDPLTEAQIQEGLDVVLAGRTSIVIAHRLSTIRARRPDHRAARTGQIVEEGSHDALMLPRRPLRRRSTTPTSATSRPTTARARASCPSARRPTVHVDRPTTP